MTEFKKVQIEMRVDMWNGEQSVILLEGYMGGSTIGGVKKVYPPQITFVEEEVE